MTSWQDLVARLTSECSRKLYGQCSVRSCLLNGGWEPNDGSGYSKAACQEWEAAALIERQAREIERLRDILDQIESMNRIGLEDVCAIARAALIKSSALTPEADDGR